MPAESTGPVAIVGAQIITMEGSAIIEEGTVVVRNGLIERVGPSSNVQVPPDAAVIDGSCRFVMPGLADMHVHLAFTTEPLLYLANGVTTIREMWGSPAHLDLREAVVSGEFVGPTMIVGSAGIRNSQFIGRAIVITDPAEVDGVIADLVATGYDFAKIHEDVDPAVYDAVVQSTQARGIDLVGHAPFLPGLERVLASHQRDIEHMSNTFVPLLRTGPGGWWDDPMDPVAMGELGQRLRAEGITVTPTLATLRAMLTPAEEAAFPNRPEARFLPLSQIQEWQQRGPFAPAALRAGATANQSRAARALATAGVRLMTGTDGGFTYVIPGFAIHDELEMLAEAGFTPAEILRIATVNPGDFMDSEFGRISPGLRADLLLLEENPLEDIRNVRTRLGVMARGRWFSETELQRKLEAFARDNRSVATISGWPVDLEMEITGEH